MIWRTPRIPGWLALVVACALVIVGCSPNVSEPPQQNRPPAAIDPPFPGAAVLPPADLTDDGPGSLIDVTPLKDSPDFARVNAVGVRVTYRSTNAKGDPTEVSGIVVVPPGKPPDGGWPILSFGHDATGVQKECAPSLAQDLGGYSGVIATLVDRGYVVAMTDYEGLGLDGFLHPLLDSVTLGKNMIDSVRAARHLLPAASNRWAAFGTGQGGLAVWGADDQAAAYGAGLELVGAVALSPYADLTGLADAVENGTLSPAQFRLETLVVASLALSPAYQIDANEYLSDAAKNQVGFLINCAVVDPLQSVSAASRLRPGDFKPKTPEAAARLRDILQGLALPGPSVLSAPMLVIYATSDVFLPPAWVEQAVRVSCARGETVEVRERIGDRSTFNDVVLYDAVGWMQGRFAGERVENVCVGV